MPDYGRNLYKKARRAAGVTQERAAELLNLGVRTLADYETGQRRPPAQTVASMAALYGAPLLGLAHLREVDELGVIPQAETPARFELLTLRLYNSLAAFAERRRGRQLLGIAEDGRIDEAERPLLGEIMDDLEEIGAALLALRCVAGIKKCRPDVGASERRGEKHKGQRTLDGECIIPQNAAKCNPFSGGGAEK